MNSLVLLAICSYAILSLHAFSEKWGRMWSSDPIYPSLFSIQDLARRLVGLLQIDLLEEGQLCFAAITILVWRETGERGRVKSKLNWTIPPTYLPPARNVSHIIHITVMFGNSRLQLTSELHKINQLCCLVFFLGLLTALVGRSICIL